MASDRGRRALFSRINEEFCYLVRYFGGFDNNEAECKGIEVTFKISVRTAQRTICFSLTSHSGACICREVASKIPSFYFLDQRFCDVTGVDMCPPSIITAR